MEIIFKQDMFYSLTYSPPFFYLQDSSHTAQLFYFLYFVLTMLSMWLTLPFSRFLPSESF